AGRGSCRCFWSAGATPATTPFRPTSDFAFAVALSPRTSRLEPLYHFGPFVTLLTAACNFRPRYSGFVDLTMQKAQHGGLTVFDVRRIGAQFLTNLFSPEQ